MLQCEAFRDEENRLKGRCRWLDREAFNGLITIQVRLADRASSRETVLKTVEDLADFGEYDAAKNNSHNWLIELLRRLKLPQDPNFALSSLGFVGKAKDIVEGLILEWH